MGLDYISLAAQSCDENAPQGAYVRDALLIHGLNALGSDMTFDRFTVCSWHGNSRRLMYQRATFP
jgi:hypothetical protein